MVVGKGFGSRDLILGFHGVSGLDFKVFKLWFSIFRLRILRFKL
jgi:hypothetical protein